MGKLYTLYINETVNNKDCDNINAYFLFLASLGSFLLYRIVSGISVYYGTGRIDFAIGQFLFEAMMYRAVWVNYEMDVEEPCSAQRWLQVMLIC